MAAMPSVATVSVSVSTEVWHGSGWQFHQSVRGKKKKVRSKTSCRRHMVGLQLITSLSAEPLCAYFTNETMNGIRKARCGCTIYT